MKGILFIFSTLILLGACTIEKRLHNPGYNIQWNKVTLRAVESSTETPITRRSEIERDQNLDSEKEITKIEVNDSIISQQPKVEVLSKKLSTIAVSQKIETSFSSNPPRIFDVKRINAVPIQKKRITKSKRDVDWELLGNIGAGILILVVLGFALFGSGTLASIAAILIAIGYVVITIAAIVCICWFLWFIFFGWWLR